MTKKELLESALADVPDDELIFVVRGSNPAAPEVLREYARRVLHVDRMSSARVPDGTTKPNHLKLMAQRHAQARKEADDVFAMADRMEVQAQAGWLVEAETNAGLRADTKNAQLEAARVVALAALAALKDS